MEYTMTDVDGQLSQQRRLLFLMWRDGFDLNEVTVTKGVVCNVTGKRRAVRAGVGEQQFIKSVGKHIDALERWVFQRDPSCQYAMLAIDGIQGLGTDLAPHKYYRRTVERHKRSRKRT